ncbi:MAG: hypothetical protein HZA54_18720 [Planctomycetes bacterium]|nr:hypothetical protein [Planctomycetota bacterium]
MPTLRQSLLVTSATGAAGGDLSGTYPNPAVAQASAAFALTGDISPAAIAADQNNYNPAGLSGAATLRISASTAVAITGLAGGADGRLLTLFNVGANNITLADEGAGSSAANRFALTADLVLAPDECCVVQYDATSSRWRAVGAARVPYGSAANTVCQGNDARLSDARTPSGSAGGDLTSTYPNPTVAKLRGKNVPSPGASEDGKFLQYDNGSSACLWTAASSSVTLDNDICEGRLTLTTGVPVTTADVTAAGTLYFTPYQGNRVALYDGAAWALATFTERSLALTLTSGKNYDVFLYDNSGTLTLELSAAWTNDTTRADALALQDGVYVKSGATTRRYLGTIRASGTNVTEDSAARRFVWNACQRLRRNLFRQESTGSWSYSTAAWRETNGTTNRVEVVVGLLGPGVMHLHVHGVITASGSGTGYNGIGEDSTSSPVGGMIVAVASSISGWGAGMSGVLDKSVPLGYHYYAWLEYGNGNATNVFNGGSIAGLSGGILA